MTRYDVLFLVGCALAVAGLACFDHRLAMLAVGAALAIAALRLSRGKPQ